MYSWRHDMILKHGAPSTLHGHCALPEHNDVTNLWSHKYIVCVLTQLGTAPSHVNATLSNWQSLTNVMSPLFARWCHKYMVLDTWYHIFMTTRHYPCTLCTVHMHPESPAHNQVTAQDFTDSTCIYICVMRRWVFEFTERLTNVKTCSSCRIYEAWHDPRARFTVHFLSLEHNIITNLWRHEFVLCVLTHSANSCLCQQ